jgi:hypothetical protein
MWPALQPTCGLQPGPDLDPQPDLPLNQPSRRGHYDGLGPGTEEPGHAREEIGDEHRERT